VTTAAAVTRLHVLPACTAAHLLARHAPAHALVVWNHRWSAAAVSRQDGVDVTSVRVSPASDLTALGVDVDARFIVALALPDCWAAAAIDVKTFK